MINRILGDSEFLNVTGGTPEPIFPNTDPALEKQVREMLEEKLRLAGLSEEEIKMALIDFENRQMHMDVDTNDFPKIIF